MITGPAPWRGEGVNTLIKVALTPVTEDRDLSERSEEPSAWAPDRRAQDTRAEPPLGESRRARWVVEGPATATEGQDAGLYGHLSLELGCAHAADSPDG